MQTYSFPEAEKRFDVAGRALDVVRQMGDLIEYQKETQTLFDFSAKVGGLVSGIMELQLEDVSRGTFLSLMQTGLSELTQAQVFGQATLRLKPGIYRTVAQFFSIDSPLVTSVSDEFISVETTFGNGQQQAFVTLDGDSSGEFFTHISSRSGASMNAAIRIKYDLRLGERVSARLRILDLLSGSVIEGPENFADGPGAGELRPDAIPFIQAVGAVYKVVVMYQCNAAKTPLARLIVQG